MTSDRRRTIAAVALIAALTIYTGVLISRASYAVGGSDSSGYANLARSLLRGEAAPPVSELDRLNLPASYAPVFTQLGYTPWVEDGAPTKIMVPYYPLGFPLHLAVGASILGWRYGPFLVSPLAGAASLLLLFFVGRRLGLSTTVAAAGATLLAFNPTFVFMATQPMSDVTAMMWALVMIWAGLRSRQDDRWASLAGAAFGIAVLVRPTNVLLLAPIVFCLRPKLKPLLLFLLGGSPMAATFLGYNYAVYGHPLKTGYGTAGLLEFITATGFATRGREYIHWLIVTMSPLLLMGWLAVAADRAVEWRDRAMLIAWFAAFLAFYVCYDIYDAWWYTRFLLPGYPALILGAMLVTRDLPGRLKVERRSLRIAMGVGLMLVALGFAIHHDREFGVLENRRGQSINADACRWADARLPARSLVVAKEMSGALKFYTNRSILRWDVVRPDQWPAVRAGVVNEGYEVYALLMQQEVQDAQQRVLGEWHEQGRFRHVSYWRIEPMDTAPPVIRYGSGFSDTEGDRDGTSWRWMAGEGVVQLQNTGRPMRLSIEGTVPLEFLRGPSTFKFVFNGQVLAERQAAEKAFLEELVVTPLQQGDGDTSELRIITDQVFVPREVDPRSRDRRRLGFSLTRLRWRELPAATR